MMMCTKRKIVKNQLKMTPLYFIRSTERQRVKVKTKMGMTAAMKRENWYAL